MGKFVFGRFLNKNILVIPVLVDNSIMPKEHSLPKSLHQLLFNQALQIRRNPDFDNDISRLFSILDKVPSLVKYAYKREKK